MYLLTYEICIGKYSDLYQRKIFISSKNDKIKMKASGLV